MQATAESTAVEMALSRGHSRSLTGSRVRREQMEGHRRSSENEGKRCFLPVLKPRHRRRRPPPRLATHLHGVGEVELLGRAAEFLPGLELRHRGFGQGETRMLRK